MTLVIDNQGAQAILVEEPRASGDLDIALDAGDDFAPATVPPGGSVAIDASVRKSLSAPASSTIALLVPYTTSGVEPTTRRVATAPLAITTPEEAEPPAVSVEIKSKTRELHEYQKNDVFVVLRNNTASTRVVASVEVSGPDFLTINLLNPPAWRDEKMDSGLLRLTPPDMQPLRLDRGVSAVFHLQVVAESQVQQGENLVVATVTSANTEGRDAMTTVGSFDVKFSVFGDSGIAAVIGGPVLLVLPGITILVVLWILVAYVYPRVKLGSEELKPFGIDAKAALGVIALAPGLVLPWLYPAITDTFFNQRRDYLDAYGLRDIANVWIISVVIGVLLWLLFPVGIPTTVASWRRLFVPGEGDGPLRVLSKLTRRFWDGSLRRTPVTYTADDGTTHPTQLLVHRRGQRSVIGPKIEYEPVDGSSQAKAKIQKAIARDHILRVTWLIGRYQRKRKITVGYAPAAGAPPTPVTVADTKVSSPQQATEIVEAKAT